MSSSIAKIPHGVRYFYGTQLAQRRAIEQQVIQVFQGWSYQEIVLPVFDYHQLFALGMGSNAERTYRFLDADGALLALRPDLTSLIARTVATRFVGTDRPIRLCYTGEVFRYKEAQEQRPHDLHQLGLEHIGNDRLEADVEVLLIAIEALKSLGIEEFKITISHAQFFKGLISALNLSPEDTERLRVIIDSRNLALLESFLIESEADIINLLEQIIVASNWSVIKEQLSPWFAEVIKDALTDLDGIFSIMESLKLSQFFEVDFGDVQGLDYYTGMRFKIYAPGIGAAIGSGGRYDALLNNFGSDEPAVGFQLSLDWLTEVARIYLKEPVVSAISAAQDLTTIFRKAQELRAKGEKIEINAHISD